MSRVLTLEGLEERGQKKRGLGDRSPSPSDRNQTRPQETHLVMDLPTYFTDFLSAIRPTASQREDLIRGHRTLRERLQKDQDLKPYLVSVFLQGSYRRQTAVRPLQETRPDVDIVVVTRVDRAKTTPDAALDLFKPFLRKWYPGKWRTQGRSLGISLSYVDLDLVVTSSPEVEEIEIIQSADDDAASVEDTPKVTQAELDALKLSPLYIPDRSTQRWEQAHPLAQMAFTTEKNAATNGHYVNIVKAIKWWRLNTEGMPDSPKSYPLEHIVGTCCPDGITSIAEGVAKTLAEIDRRCGPYADANMVPWLDNHGVAGQNVLARVSAGDFRAFVNRARSAASLARQARDAGSIAESANLWRELFGSKFPSAPNGGDGGGGNGGKFTRRDDVSSVGSGRFA